MTTFDPDLIQPTVVDGPPRLPYRPVWRGVALQTGLLVVGALVVNFGVSFAGIVLEAEQRPLVTGGLALAPVVLWLLITWWGERRADEPREGLLAIFMVAALVANAIAGPFIDGVIEPDRWINLLAGLDRMIVYTVTVGLTVECLKYLVLRYLAWPDRFHRRIDTVAYSLAVSLAFATVFNLRFAFLEGGAQPGAAALRIVSVVLAQQGVGLVMGHRLMAIKFGRESLLALPLSLLAASALHGGYIAFRAGFAVSGFGVGATANAPLFSFGFSVVFGVVLFAIFAFLIRTADARDARLTSFGRVR